MRSKVILLFDIVTQGITGGDIFQADTQQRCRPAELL